MSLKGKFKMKISFEEEPIIKVNGETIEDLEGSFKGFKKKFGGK